MTTHVGGRTHNTDRLRQLTGIVASENQACLLLGDLNYFSCRGRHDLNHGSERGPISMLTDSFEPWVKEIEGDWHGDDPIQGYYDFLNHRGDLASARRI